MQRRVSQRLANGPCSTDWEADARSRLALLHKYRTGAFAWTLWWRIRKGLRFCGIGVREMTPCAWEMALARRCFAVAEMRYSKKFTDRDSPYRNSREKNRSRVTGLRCQVSGN